MVPKQTVILLSGIPATGKSTFARYLACEHGFAHYDLEYYPCGWPHPEAELKGKWDNNRAAFVTQLRQYHDRIVLDWGFRVSFISWVNELRDLGVTLIWFDGDVVCARKKFCAREASKGRFGTEVSFNSQIEDIKREGYPASLKSIVVPALSADGIFLHPHQIERTVFSS